MTECIYLVSDKNLPQNVYKLGRNHSTIKYDKDDKYQIHVYISVYKSAKVEGKLLKIFDSIFNNKSKNFGAGCFEGNLNKMKSTIFRTVEDSFEDSLEDSSLEYSDDDETLSDYSSEEETKLNASSISPNLLTMLRDQKNSSIQIQKNESNKTNHMKNNVQFNKHWSPPTQHGLDNSSRLF